MSPRQDIRGERIDPAQIDGGRRRRKPHLAGTNQEILLEAPRAHQRNQPAGEQ